MVTDSAIPRTPAGNALTALVLDLFKVNGLLLTTGDRLGAPLRMTSARWRMLGAIDRAVHPQPVAWLARNLGANRQNVQRIINDLNKEGLVAFAPNPHHRRAQLVVLTDKGRQTLDATRRLQVPWINSVASGLQVEEIETAHRVLVVLRRRLEANGEAESESQSPVERQLATS
jgi:DNA-binding MarR family transcriptional regulator